MYPTGLNASEQRSYITSLMEPHRIQVRAYVLDLNHRTVDTITNTLSDGQVDVEGLTRSASLTLLDPALALPFDSADPDTGSLYMDRMIRIWYGVYSERLPKWVWVPLITGPITAFSRDGAYANITLSDKSSLHSRSAWRTIAYKKGTRKSEVLRSLLRDVGGETHLDLNHTTAKTSGPVTLTSQTNLWEFATSCARWWGAQSLAYDGMGTCRLLTLNANSVFTFWKGDADHRGTLKTNPKITYGGEEVVNIVRVTGGTPKGAKKPLTYQIAAPNGHPLSPYRLGMGGKPRYLGKEIEDTNLTKMADVQALAKRELSEGLINSTQMDFETLPVPCLEPWDVVTVLTDRYTARQRMHKYSIPLKADGAMTVGRTGRVSKWRR